MLEQQLTAPRFGFDSGAAAAAGDAPSWRRRSAPAVTDRRRIALQTAPAADPRSAVHRDRLLLPRGIHADEHVPSSPAPDEQLTELEGVPLTLLPVRLETRFVARRTRRRSCASASTPTRYISTRTSRGLTPAEVAAGQAYWRNRWDTAPTATAPRPGRSSSAASGRRAPPGSFAR